jgi:hypothetical protein
MKSRIMRRSMHVAGMGDIKGEYGRPELMRPLGRSRRRWEDNIKMDLKKWDRRMDLIYLA